MSYLYGSHVTKVGISRVTEGVPQYAGIFTSTTLLVLMNKQGVVVFNSATVPIPLGFGVAAQPTDMIKSLEPTAICIINQGDIGEWLRSEQELS